MPQNLGHRRPLTFDYIIVGAGSAGCVLANRLSADPGTRVLLLEAGGKDTHPLIRIPGAYMRLHKSAVDWNCYYTQPQPFLANRRIYHPRGKVLGGSSATNAMAYIRGQREDFDHWKSLGCNGWGYEDVLPLFKKSEDNEQFENDYHAKGGPLHVTQAHWYHTRLGEAFIAACISSGIPANNDVNGASQEGAGWFQYTIRDGQRQSTADAFLHPVRKRTNLTILARAMVSGLKIDSQRITGISFRRGSSNMTATAKREVILCAGAFETPKLLMLSGIGDPAMLKSAGIETRHELPGVGLNLQDHLFFPVSSLCSLPISNNRYLPLYQQVWQGIKYAITRKGPLSIGPLEAVAFFRSDSGISRPDLQFQFTPTNAGDDHVADMYNLSSFPHTDGYTILPTQVRPESRGFIRITSTDPGAPPVIDPQYLSSEADRKVLLAGGKKALEVLESSPFDPYRKRTHLPQRRDSDEAWLQYIAHVAECVYHPVGTCKMGNGAEAVVNPDLKLIGLDGLRIADASVMPVITSGNTNAPVIMIAEMAARKILGT